MSNCCNAKVIDPSGEGIEGVCADCGEHCEVVSDGQFDVKLDEILFRLARYTTLADRAADSATTAKGVDDASKSYQWSLGGAKQSIKQLIASELGAIIDANMNEDGSVDSYRVYEVLMEWMGELQGGGDE